MVVGADGHVHIAASLGPDVYYVTNATGRWTRERIGTAPRRGSHTDAQIVLDGDGSLWIAFVDRCRGCAPDFSEGVYLVSNSSGAWGEPVRIGEDYRGEGPLLQMRADGIHIADTDTDAPEPTGLTEIFRPIYVTNAGGRWVVTQVAERGRSIATFLPPEGPPSIIYATPAAELFIAVGNADGTDFESTRIGDAGVCYQAAAFGADGEAHVVSSVGTGPADYPCETTGQNLYARTRGGEWEDPIEIPHRADQLAVAGDGSVHGLGWASTDQGMELWYFGNQAGQFESHRVTSYGTVDSWPDGTLAVDAQGRPHIFFSSSFGTFYAVGPAS